MLLWLLITSVSSKLKLNLRSFLSWDLLETISSQGSLSNSGLDNSFWRALKKVKQSLLVFSLYFCRNYFCLALDQERFLDLCRKRNPACRNNGLFFGLLFCSVGSEEHLDALASGPALVSMGRCLSLVRQRLLMRVSRGEGREGLRFLRLVEGFVSGVASLYLFAN